MLQQIFQISKKIVFFFEKLAILIVNLGPEILRQKFSQVSHLYSTLFETKPP